MTPEATDAPAATHGSDTDDPEESSHEVTKRSIVRVPVEPKVIKWALERSGLRADADARTGTLESNAAKWIAKETLPTYKQLRDFAKRTNVAFGLLLLDEPIEEEPPLLDYRTIANANSTRPSGNLLDTIYACEQRQQWYRDYLLDEGAAPLAFVGSIQPTDNIAESVDTIRNHIHWQPDSVQLGPSERWEGAVRDFRHKIESSGILVMMSSFVANNTHRALDPTEFRGFAMVDEYAPLIFVNTRDAFSAQMFTLSHELAHIFANRMCLSTIDQHLSTGTHETETWCNAVAAELLVPQTHLRSLSSEINVARFTSIRSLARHFAVSPLVIVYRLHDLGLISDSQYARHRQEIHNAHAQYQDKDGGGGNYYRVLPTRVSPTFASAVISRTREGKTLFREAFQLLGLRSTYAMNSLASELGFDG